LVMPSTEPQYSDIKWGPRGGLYVDYTNSNGETKPVYLSTMRKRRLQRILQDKLPPPVPVKFSHADNGAKASFTLETQDFPDGTLITKLSQIKANSKFLNQSGESNFWSTTRNQAADKLFDHLLFHFLTSPANSLRAVADNGTEIASDVAMVFLQNLSDSFVGGSGAYLPHGLQILQHGANLVASGGNDDQWRSHAGSLADSTLTVAGIYYGIAIHSMLYSGSPRERELTSWSDRTFRALETTTAELSFGIRGLDLAYGGIHSHTHQSESTENGTYTSMDSLGYHLNLGKSIGFQEGFGAETRYQHTSEEQGGITTDQIVTSEQPKRFWELTLGSNESRFMVPIGIKRKEFRQIRRFRSSGSLIEHASVQESPSSTRRDRTQSQTTEETMTYNSLLRREDQVRRSETGHFVRETSSAQESPTSRSKYEAVEHGAYEEENAVCARSQSIFGTVEDCTKRARGQHRDTQSFVHERREQFDLHQNGSSLTARISNETAEVEKQESIRDGRSVSREETAHYDVESTEYVSITAQEGTKTCRTDRRASGSRKRHLKSAQSDTLYVVESEISSSTAVCQDSHRTDGPFSSTTTHRHSQEK